MGKSLCEFDLIPAAQELMKKVNIPLPTDVVVGKEFSETAEATIKSVDDVAEDDMIFDIGPDSAAQSSRDADHHGHHYLEWPSRCF